MCLQGSERAGDIACDTPFEPTTDADADVSVNNDKLQLKRVVIDIPAGHDLTGLVFVCKSKDDTMWWRDGELQLHYMRLWLHCWTLAL